MLYQAYQTQSDLMSPYRLLAQGSSAGLWLDNTQGSWMRKLSASMEVFSRMRLTHSRPAYGITSVMVGEQALAALVAPVYAFVATFVLLRVIELVMPLRATEHEEAQGMDVRYHGEEAYVTGEGAILVTPTETEVPAPSPT